MRQVLAVLSLSTFALTGCKDTKTTSTSERTSDEKKPDTTAHATGERSSAAPTGSASRPPGTSSLLAAPHKAPRDGKLAGKAFSPEIVILEDTSDGAKLGFYQRSVERRKRERWRCEEPLGDAEVEMTVYKHIEDWKVGAPLEIPIEDWSGTGISFNQKTPGKATVTLTKKDAEAFRLEGTIELASDDGSWKLSGPFEGEYCPMKGIARETPEPLATMPWTLDPVAADKLPKTPVSAIIAGRPAKIAHASIRQRKRLDVVVQELTFFAETPPDPCSVRPEGGWLTSYKDDGRISSRDGAKFRDDSFSVFLAAPPTKGALLSGVNSGSKEATKDIVDANLEVFEADGYRSWKYAQYFSAAVAFDEVDDKSIRGRVFVALPDQGKSTIVGAFEAVRCPALE